jgi:hypothetical protein
MSIPAHLQTAFHWLCAESDTHVDVTFTFPAAFDLTSVRLRLFRVDSHHCISVTIPNEPFLLYGVLAGDALSAHLLKDDATHAVTARIVKSNAQMWHLPVKLPIRGLNGIDAKSAYHLGTLLLQKTESTAMQLLRHSANSGFVPAIVQLGDLFLNGPETFEEGMSLLNVAADRYGDDHARCKISMWNVLNGSEATHYVQFLRRAADQDIVLAHVYLGRVLSPMSDVPWKEKDGRRALAHLEHAVEADASEEALVELAKLLYAGCDGVTQDRQRAAKFYQHARELAQADGRNLPPLTATDRNAEETGSAPLLGFAAAALVVAGFFMARRRG